MISNTREGIEKLWVNLHKGHIVIMCKKKRSEIASQLVEGQVVDGVVKSISDYNAFIDFEGITGSLHIGNMAWRRVIHPSDIVAVGDVIKVKIVYIDPKSQKIVLGIKQLEEDPWITIEQRFSICAHFNGKITKITDYGAFVELEKNIEGLIHISEMGSKHKNQHPSEIVYKGEEVYVQVIDIDNNKRRISLSLKECQGNP